MQHKKYDHNIVNTLSGTKYNLKTNSFKRNINRVNINNDTKLQKKNEVFDIKISEKILNNNRLISETIDNAKNLYNTTEHSIPETKAPSNYFPRITISIPTLSNSFKSEEDSNKTIADLCAPITSKGNPTSFGQSIATNNGSPSCESTKLIFSRKNSVPFDIKKGHLEKNPNSIKIDPIEYSASHKNFSKNNSLGPIYQKIVAQNIIKLDRQQKNKGFSIGNDSSHLLGSKKFESLRLDSNQSLEIDTVYTPKTENIPFKLQKDDKNAIFLPNEKLRSYQYLMDSMSSSPVNNDTLNTQEIFDSNFHNLQENKQSLLNLKRLKDKVNNGRNNSISHNFGDFQLKKRFSLKSSYNLDMTATFDSHFRKNMHSENHVTNLNGLLSNSNQESNNTMINHKAEHTFFPDLLVPKLNIENNGNDGSQIKILDYLVLSEEYMNIKKELPTFLSDAPASRQEVIILRNWLDLRIREIMQNSHLLTEEKENKVDEVYNLCLNEIFRQVSMECKERGKFLSTIWTSYLEKFDQFKSIIKENEKKLLMESENSYNRVHKMYKEKIQSQIQMISELKNEIKVLLDMNKLLDKDCQKAFQHTEQISKKSHGYKKLLEACKQQNVDLQRQNDIYSTRFNATSKKTLKKISSIISQEEKDKSSDTLLSDDDSLELVFEIKPNEKYETINVKSLNSIICNTDLKMRYSDIATQTFSRGDTIVNTIKETQTDFNLIDNKYDLIFENQKVLDEILLEQKFKNELDMVHEAKLIYIKQDGTADNRLQHSQTTYGTQSYDPITKQRESSWNEYKKQDSETNVSNKTIDLIGKHIKINLKTHVGINIEELSETTAEPTKNSNKIHKSSFEVRDKNLYEFDRFEILEDKDASLSSDSNTECKIKRFGSIPLDLNIKLDNAYELIKRNLKVSDTNKRSIRIPIIPNDEFSSFSVKFLAFSDESQKIGLKLIDSVVNNQSRKHQKEAFIRIIRLYKIECEKNRVYEQVIFDLHNNNANLKNTNAKLTQEIMVLDEKFHKDELKIPIPSDFDSELKGIIEVEKCINCERQNHDSKTQNHISSPKHKLLQSRTSIFTEDSLHMIFKKGLSIPGIDHPNLERRLFQKKDNFNMGAVIIKQLKTLNIGKFKNYMTLKEVLKLITQIYEERMIQNRESSIAKEEEFSNFSLRIFQLKIRGTPKIALEKFVIFLLSLKKYMHIIRVNLFTKFLGFNENLRYNLDELNHCIDILEFVNNNTNGTTIFNGETDSRHFVPFLRVSDYMKLFGENKLELEDYNKFRKELDSIKESDPKGINKYGVMDIDLFILKILTKYQEMCYNTKQYVINAFKAADLDSNHTCSLKEFDLLYKYIESEKYDEEFVKEIFEENADINTNDEKALSFHRFTVICVEYSLFSDEQQDLFLKLKGNNEIEEEFLRLRQSWENYGKEIKEQLSTLEKDDHEYWSQIYEILNQRIHNETNYKPFLIALSLLNKEIMSIKMNKVLKEQIY